MCELCNGNHVFRIMTSYSIEFHPCPKCGPLSEEKRLEDLTKFREKIAVAKERIRRREYESISNYQ
jgi:hypothetical protein